MLKNIQLGCRSWFNSSWLLNSTNYCSLLCAPGEASGSGTIFGRKALWLCLQVQWGLSNSEAPVSHPATLHLFLSLTTGAMLHWTFTSTTIASERNYCSLVVVLGRTISMADTPHYVLHANNISKLSCMFHYCAQVCLGPCIFRICISPVGYPYQLRKLQKKPPHFRSFKKPPLSH
jgi:hypothetical protein